MLSPPRGSSGFAPHPLGDAGVLGAHVLSVASWCWPVSPLPSHPTTLIVRHRGLPTDRYMWSDASGLHECTKAGTKPPSLQWTWVSSGLRGRGWHCGPPRLTFLSSRFLTGLWISAFPGARTRRGGSMPVTSLRKCLSARGGALTCPAVPGRSGPRRHWGAAEEQTPVRPPRLPAGFGASPRDELRSACLPHLELSGRLREDSCGAPPCPCCPGGGFWGVLGSFGPGPG